MPRTPRNVRQVQAIRALVRAGGVENRRAGRGSHVRITMPNRARVTIPGGVLKPGTLEAIVKQAGLTMDEFTNLL